MPTAHLPGSGIERWTLRVADIVADLTNAPSPGGKATNPPHSGALWHHW